MARRRTAADRRSELESRDLRSEAGHIDVRRAGCLLRALRLGQGLAARRGRARPLRQTQHACARLPGFGLFLQQPSLSAREGGHSRVPAARGGGGGNLFLVTLDLLRQVGPAPERYSVGGRHFRPLLLPLHVRDLFALTECALPGAADVRRADSLHRAGLHCRLLDLFEIRQHRTPQLDRLHDGSAGRVRGIRDPHFLPVPHSVFWRG
mmetsp:Transcript_44232/g.109504  ORF Transcript_44232/g.109504 Transcript_44232/m.109504 type:complete len:208 (-) Transcript_44232:1279-1902(-)